MANDQDTAGKPDRDPKPEFTVDRREQGRAEEREKLQQPLQPPFRERKVPEPPT